MFAKYLLAMFLVVSCGAFAQAPAQPNAAAPAAKPKFHAYDPGRDAARDVQLAVEEAAKTHRRVLMKVGGNWCSWCRYLENFFEANPDVHQLLDEKFVVVKVNFSEENENKELLKDYPKIGGYPHFFVLDDKGKLLQSQDTSVLEQGKGYSREAMLEFLKKWGPE